ncbi:MAG: hypothetical protein PHY29_07860 [Syntrophales bacterium]|nr:hypothetical protein [Syntrophales bacterium]
MIPSVKLIVLRIVATMADIYGMNFGFIPKLKIRWAYSTLRGAMIAVAADKTGGRSKETLTASFNIPEIFLFKIGKVYLIITIGQ